MASKASLCRQRIDCGIAMKYVKDADSITTELVRFKGVDGSSSIISKFQALRYAGEAGMELYVDEVGSIPTAEMRRPRKVKTHGKSK